MSRTRPWEVRDELWERVRLLIPPRPSHAKGGRPAAEDRQMLSAIVSVLPTRIQGNALPRELGASSTVYDRFRQWEAQGFFQRLWQAELLHYDELLGSGGDWQRVDSSTVTAPCAQAAVGPAPPDGGKQGTQRSLLCDRRGLPPALLIEGANRQDSKLLFATLDALPIQRPEPTVSHPQNVCLDAAYDHDPIDGELYERGFEPPVRLNPQDHKWDQPDEDPANSLEAGKTPRRCVVERLFSWLNRWRRLLLRWAKLGETYHAFLQLACGLICFQYTSSHVSVSG
jgi:putative transposase